MNPYAIIDEVKKATGSPPKRVIGNNRRSVKVEVGTKKQSERITEVEKIDNIQYQIKVHPRYNYAKAIIYVHEFEMENIEEFKEGLKLKYNITDIQPAPFIKTKSAQTQVFILTFQQEHLPYSIYIPGERQDTRVFKFKSKPIMCNNCLQYAHSKKYGKRTEPTCRKCSASGHCMAECTSDTAKCLHCSQAHSAGSRDCVKQQREEAIMQVQKKRR